MKKNYIFLSLIFASSLIFAQSNIEQAAVPNLSAVSISNKVTTNISTGTVNTNISTTAKKAIIDSLHYDGPVANSIGLGAGTFEAHAFFSAAQLAGHNANGNTITSMKVYIDDIDSLSSTQLKFYSDQSTMVYSQAFTPIEGWNEVILTTPFAIPTTDLYVGYEWVAIGAGYPLGTDAGPTNPNGDWIKHPGGWAHLSSIGGSSNWNIRAMVDGTPLTDPDVAVTATPVEYTVYPLSQVTNIVGDANLQSLGGDVTGATVTVNVYDGTFTNVHTETSTAASIPGGNDLDYTGFTGYIPTAVGNYFVEYIASITETDVDMTNDTTLYLVQVSDSIYARDNSDISGVIGQAGIGTGNGGAIGNMFQITNDDTLTSVQIFIANQDGKLDGQDLIAKVYSWTGSASTEIATTIPVSLNSATNAAILHELKFTSDIILGPGMYVLAVQEADSSIQIGYTNGLYTPNGTLVTATGYTSDFQDLSGLFGGAQIVPIVRGVFGTPDISTGISDNNNNTNFEVFPNPAVENITVKNALGSTIEIYNNLGQVVYTNLVNNNNFNVNVSSFDNGVYTIKSTTDNNTSTQSFVKQ